MTARIERRRVGAIFRKELREYRHNGNIIYAMALLPAIFLVQPIIEVFTVTTVGAAVLRHEHSLLYLLAIPALVPATLAAYSVVGERVQGTLEPLLSTPIRREASLLGKALAAFVPAVAVAYTIFALYVMIVEFFAKPGVAPLLINGPDVVAQLVFTPLLATLSIWVAIAVSTRSSDPRNAAQLATLACLPTVAVTSLIAFEVIPATLPVALGFGAALLVLIRVGWRVASALFDRERLVTATR